MSSTSKLSTFSNPEYSTGASLFKRLAWFIASALIINSYCPVPMVFKVIILKLFGAKIGKGVIIKPKLNIKYPWLLSIGNNTWLGEKVWIDNLVQVNIGNDCCLSQGAMLLTGNHNYKKSSFDLITGKIVIDDGVWVGAKAVVCPGITLASHSILTVATVATKSTTAYGIYQGNPAIKIKEREILD